MKEVGWQGCEEKEMSENEQWSANAFVVNTSRKLTTFGCCVFFHKLVNCKHLVFVRRKPSKKHVLLDIVTAVKVT